MLSNKNTQQYLRTTFGFCFSSPTIVESRFPKELFNSAKAQLLMLTLCTLYINVCIIIIIIIIVCNYISQCCMAVPSVL